MRKEIAALEDDLTVRVCLLATAFVGYWLIIILLLLLLLLLLRPVSTPPRRSTSNISRRTRSI